MRKILISIVIIFTSITSNSQIVFNKIIEDTAAHIVNSVVALDTGYVFLSGTRNIYNIRSFALTYIDEIGEKKWKKIFGDVQNQLWEGWYGNLKQYENNYCFAGSYVNTVESKRGIHINRFDSLFNLKYQNIIFYDSIDKRIYHSMLSSNYYFYLTGIIYCPNTNKNKMILLKADSLGNYLWHKILGNYVYEYGSYIIETSNGNILTGGDTWVTHINNTRWYLIKTDTAGNIIWEKVFGRNNYPNGYIQGLVETNDSNFIACGSYPVARYGGGGGHICGMDA